MSALIRQSHANNTDPLWASSQGGEDIVTDTITINTGGSIIFDGSSNVVLGQNGVVPGLAVYDQSNDYQVLQLANIHAFGTNQTIQASYLSFDGSGGAFGLSWGTPTARTVYLNGLDSGANCILTSACVGPNPVSFVPATVTVPVVPTSPSLPDAFSFPAYPTVTGEEYSICCKGAIDLVSGTPDPALDDIFIVVVSVGGGAVGTQNFIFNPITGTWTVFDRLICETGISSIAVTVRNFQRGTSTAVYSASMTMGDIVRVK